MDERSAAGPPADLADTARHLKAIVIGSAGNLVEWYDFYTYSAFALYFASAFFPGDDPTAQQLNAAVALCARLHHASHRRMAVRASRRPSTARRQSLMLSVLLMCFGSLMIAVTPTYASIGIARAACCSASRA